MDSLALLAKLIQETEFVRRSRGLDLTITTTKENAARNEAGLPSNVLL